MFVAEAHTSDEHLLKLYGTEAYPVAHYPYIFMLEYIRSALNAPELDSRIQSWLKKLPKHSVSCWMVGEIVNDERIEVNIDLTNNVYVLYYRLRITMVTELEVE